MSCGWKLSVIKQLPKEYFAYMRWLQNICFPQFRFLLYMNVFYVKYVFLKMCYISMKTTAYWKSIRLNFELHFLIIYIYIIKYIIKFYKRTIHFKFDNLNLSHLKKNYSQHKLCIFQNPLGQERVSQTRIHIN